MKGHFIKTRFSMIVVGSLCLSALYADQSMADSLPVVTVDYVKSNTVVDRIPFSGTVVAREEVHVSSQLSGLRINQISVEVGSLVKEGDVLITMDAQQLENELAQIDFDVALAEANIRQSSNRITASQASLKMANAVLHRHVELSKSGSVSQSILDESRGEADEASASLAITKENSLIAKITKAQLQEKQKLISLNLSRTVITAPRSGLITSRSAHIGAMVFASSEPLLTLLVDSDIELSAEVLDTSLARITVGDKAQITLADGSVSQGEIRMISPTVDPRTRLGEVKVSLSDTSNLRIGSFAHGWLNANAYKALVVPNSAVQWSSHGDQVSVVTAGVIEKRRVVLGSVHEGLREIREGLVAGEQVLIRAGSFFKNGDRVSVVEAETNANRVAVKTAQMNRVGGML
jgi:HlyD family secretion protein